MLQTKPLCYKLNLYAASSLAAVPAPCNAAFGGPQQALQVLRLLALPVHKCLWRVAAGVAGAQITSFTCTQVETLTPKELQPKVLSLLALLVQKYKY